MNAIVNTLFAETRRMFASTTRYPLEFAFSVVIMLSIFYGIVFGAKVMGADIGATGGHVLLIGYVTWLLGSGAATAIANDIQTEIRGGTLENILVSETPLTWLLLARTMLGYVFSIFFVLAMVCGVYVVSHIVLRPSINTLWGLTTLFLEATGVAFVLAGLALVLKRIQYLVIAIHGAIFPMAFLKFNVEAVDALGVFLGWAPLISSIELIRCSFDTLPCLSGAVTNGLFAGLLYFALGVAIFHKLRGVAAKRGTLGER